MKLLRSALGLAKKALLFYVTRIWEAVKYVVTVAGATGITAAVMIPLGILTSLLLQHLGYDMSLPADPVDMGAFNWKEAVGLFMVVAVMEETYCRYILQDCILGRWLKMPPWAALWTAAILFGAAHLGNPGSIVARLPQAIGATGAGVWFGLIYRRKGLHFGIAVHFLYDFGVTMMSRFF